MFPSFSASCYCIHPQTHVREVQNHLTPSCGACECPIAGKMLNCSACDSDLHPFCKTGPQCLFSALHPVPDHPLTRLTRDPIMGHAPNRKCSVCSEEIKGVSYTCPPCGFDVHPQCSQLPRVVPPGPGTHPHELVLQVAEFVDRDCHVCGGRCGRWAYSCGACSVYVHFSCIVKPPATAIGGPTTTASRELARNYCRFDQDGQGQRFGGQPPHHYYNNGGFHHNNNNNNAGGGGPPTGGFMAGIVGRIAGSLAVGLLCEMVSSMLF